MRKKKITYSEFRKGLSEEDRKWLTAKVRKLARSGYWIYDEWLSIHRRRTRADNQKNAMRSFKDRQRYGDKKAKARHLLVLADYENALAAQEAYDTVVNG